MEFSGLLGPNLMTWNLQMTWLSSPSDTSPESLTWASSGPDHVWRLTASKAQQNRRIWDMLYHMGFRLSLRCPVCGGGRGVADSQSQILQCKALTVCLFKNFLVVNSRLRILTGCLLKNLMVVNLQLRILEWKALTGWSSMSSLVVNPQSWTLQCKA